MSDRCWDENPLSDRLERSAMKSTRPLLALFTGAALLALGAGQASAQEDPEDVVESEVEAQVEASVEEQVQSEIENSIEAAIEDDAQAASDEAEQGEIDIENESDRSRATPNAQADVRDIEIDLDPSGNRIVKGEWVALVSPADLQELERRGLEVAEVRELLGLGLLVARIIAPPGSLPQHSLPVQSTSALDFDHLYSPQEEPSDTDSSWRPTDALDTHTLGAGDGAVIGMIDSAVDLAHPSLLGRHISERDFVVGRAPRPQAHGTAVASILVGRSSSYRGLLPGATLFAASVFFETPDGAQSASALSLVQALDWLVQSGVTAINVSLAGPDNAVLRAAVLRAQQLGVVVIAAAGNEGPASAPVYPAAYDDVVAVIAIDRSLRPYRLSNRGAYVDFAAPGVDVLHAQPNGGYAASSGTSVAAPFVTTLIAAGRRRQDAETVLDTLRTRSLDLGPPGRDDIFGFGLVRVP